MNTEKDTRAMTDIFGSLFYLTNRLQTIIDKDFRDYNITMKQWFLMAVIGRFFEEPPKLIDVAVRMGSSYQNVKQLSLKLQENGYVALEKDKRDKRALRIRLTEQASEFWLNRYEEDKIFFERLFKHFNSEEILRFLEYIEKLVSTVIEL